MHTSADKDVTETVNGSERPKCIYVLSDSQEQIQPNIINTGDALFDEL